MGLFSTGRAGATHMRKPTVTTIIVQKTLPTRHLWPRGRNFRIRSAAQVAVPLATGPASVEFVVANAKQLFT
jgi:hypothetical protein